MTDETFGFFKHQANASWESLKPNRSDKSYVVHLISLTLLIGIGIRIPATWLLFELWKSIPHFHSSLRGHF